MFESIISWFKNFFSPEKSEFSTNVLSIVNKYFDKYDIVDEVGDESYTFIYKETCAGYLHIDLHQSVAIITFASTYSSAVIEDEYTDLKRIDELLKTVSELM